jgi:hypothetical protein
MKSTFLKTTALAIALSASTTAFADKASDTLYAAFTKELESVDSVILRPTNIRATLPPLGNGSTI